MDTYDDRLSAVEVAARVRGSISSQVPLSIIRLGDGEARLLGWPEHTERRLIAHQLVYWFGHTQFHPYQIDAMADELRWAILQADIIGLPRPDQVAKNHEYAKVTEYMEYHRILNGQAFTNASLHREFAEQGLYQSLMTGEVHLITCRDVGERLAGVFDIPVMVHPIPEEGNTGRRQTNHYPEVFERFREMLSHSTAGQLWLVGAGVLGKIYCAWIKLSGGVALDIGSIFDGWAGVVSRSYIRDDPGLYTLAV